MIEREVGDTFYINGAGFIVEPSHRCDGCEFKDVDCSQIADVLGRCKARRRKDGCDVVFVRKPAPDDVKMDMIEFKRIISDAMFRLSESMGMGVELRCHVDTRPSMGERKFGLYNFHVIIGNEDKGK